VAEASPRLDAQHPWPWLDPFDEAASGCFNGRDEDAQALLRGVLASPVCVLFGKSGLGKTSLLLAGLFPLLRARQLLPVALRRFEHGDAAASLSTQLLRALDEAVADAGLHWQGSDAEPGDDDVARLWERLHDRQQPLLDASGRRWMPVFVLDQFEEVFTLQTEEQRRQRVFPPLGDLLENRVPPAVDARLAQHDALIDRIDPDSQPYRVLVALREDFLPELEAWTELIPRLGPNRVRLLPMSRAQALDAVQKTGGELVDATSAQAIVDFLGRHAAGAAGAGTRRGGREARQIEPALLSLVCASLNADRLAAVPPGATIAVAGLETRGARILDRFYDEAFAGLPEATREAAAHWVETDLITDGGTRRPYPVAGLDGSLREAMRHLVNRRLLRVENTDQGDQVELVHDRLAAVAQQRARRSQQQVEAAALAQREAADAQARLLAERADFESRRAEEAVATTRRLQRLILAAGTAALVAAAGVVVAIGFYLRSQSATAQAQKALAESQALIAGLDQRSQDALQRSQALQEALSAAEKTRQAAELLKGNDRSSRAKADTLLSEVATSLKSAAREATPLKTACPAGARVYPQVGDAKDSDAIDPLARSLRAAGFLVPKTEIVGAAKVPATLELRYFRATEIDVAVAAAAALSGVTVKYVRGYEDSTSIRPCHLELWLPLGAGR
jgi:hypothetical protein